MRYVSCFNTVRLATVWIRNLSFFSLLRPVHNIATNWSNLRSNEVRLLSVITSSTRPLCTKEWRAIDPDQVAAINHFAHGDLVPDLTILIDVDPEIGLKRARENRNSPLDRIEQET